MYFLLNILYVILEQLGYILNYNFLTKKKKCFDTDDLPMAVNI